MSNWTTSVFAVPLPLALLVNHFRGEPPPRRHPVVWIGRYLNRIAPHLSPAPPAAPEIRDLKANQHQVHITRLMLAIEITAEAAVNNAVFPSGDTPWLAAMTARQGHAGVGSGKIGHKLVERALTC